MFLTGIWVVTELTATSPYDLSVQDWEEILPLTGAGKLWCPSKAWGCHVVSPDLIQKTDNIPILPREAAQDCEVPEPLRLL